MDSLYLYGVTDSKYTMPIEEQVEKAIIGGTTFIQIREKNISETDYIKKAKKVKNICDKYGVPFVVNDNINVAKIVNASGVHIGQDDGNIKVARDILGKDKIIGVSANTIEDAITAQKNGADYIGIGAVFSTSTKTNVNVIGIEKLKEIANSVNIPSVAIGGITFQNFKILKNTGINGIAVVSCLFGADDITLAAKNLCKWGE